MSRASDEPRPTSDFGKISNPVDSSMIKQYNIDMIISKIEHERNVIMFLYNGCGRMNKLSKLKDNLDGFYLDQFVFSMPLICKKLVYISTNLKEQLQLQKSFFDMPNLLDFIQMDEYKQNLARLEKDDHHYETLQNNVINKLKDADRYQPESQDLRKWVLFLVESKNPPVEEINREIYEIFQKLLQEFGKEKSVFPSETNEAIQKGLTALYFCLNSDNEFPFLTNEILFDWNGFEKNFQHSTAFYQKTLYEALIKEYPLDLGKMMLSAAPVK